LARPGAVRKLPVPPATSLHRHMDAHFAVDAGLRPARVIVATETHAPTIDEGWAAVMVHPHVIGDFTWTGWDYLGEAGIGRIEYGGTANALGMAAFLGPYPWLTAWCGDIDITGQRRPQSYYREIVFGLRSEPYLAVHRPENHGRVVTHASPWSWDEVVSSWSWPGHEGRPVTVEVYAAADEVEMLLNGRSVGRRPAGGANRYRAAFEIVYEPAELTAVSWLGDGAVSRTSLRSASERVKDRPVRTGVMRDGRAGADRLSPARADDGRAVKAGRRPPRRLTPARIVAGVRYDAI
jgi:beta-galactosidase